MTRATTTGCIAAENEVGRKEGSKSKNDAKSSLLTFNMDAPKRLQIKTSIAFEQEPSRTLEFYWYRHANSKCSPQKHLDESHTPSIIGGKLNVERRKLVSPCKKKIWTGQNRSLIKSTRFHQWSRHRAEYAHEQQSGFSSAGCILLILTWAVWARPWARPVATVVGWRRAPTTAERQTRCQTRTLNATRLLTHYCSPVVVLVVSVVALISTVIMTVSVSPSPAAATATAAAAAAATTTTTTTSTSTTTTIAVERWEQIGHDVQLSYLPRNTGPCRH